MRIGVIASIAHRLPPRRLRAVGADRLHTDRGLRRARPRVTLFASADSETSALHGTAPTGYEEDPNVDAKVWEGLHNAAVFERAGEFDVIANHFDFMPLTYSRLVSTPVVTTIHGFSSPRSCRSIGHTMTSLTTSRSVMPTATPTCTMPPRSTMGST